MKVFKLITKLSLVLFMAVAATSCLSSSDDYSGQVTASDFVNVGSYSGQNVTFYVKTATGGTVTLYSDQAAKVDQTKFSEGSRAYITYSYQVGQDVNKPIKVSLMSINPVTVVRLDDVMNRPELSYRSFTTSRVYCIGDYVNMIVSVQKAKTRRWECYYDSSAGIGGESADIYLNTEATDEEPASEGVALSLDVARLVSGNGIKTLRLHVNDQNGYNHVYEIKVSE